MKYEANITRDRVDYIHKHIDNPVRELMDATELSEYVVKTIRLVKEKGWYGPRKRTGMGYSHFQRKIEASDNLMSAKQAMKYLGMNEFKFYTKLQNGEIRGKKFNDLWVLRKKDLKEYLELKK